MNNTQEYWDPFYKKITEFSDKKSDKLTQKLLYYHDNPHIPIRNLILCALPGIICLGLFVFSPQLLTKILNLTPDLAIFIVFISFMPVFFYYGYIHSLERDLVKIMVAQKQNWKYNTQENRTRWQKAVQNFPEFFRRGNNGQNLQDEFWGKFQGQDFYQAVFQYKVKSHGKNKSNHTYYRTIFAIKLPKALKSTFRLESRSFGFFRFRSSLETESHEFNKYYTVKHNNEEDQAALNVIQTLSPALIEKLIKLKNEEKKPQIFFKEDTVIFMFHGRLLPKMKTNFFRKVELDPRDQEFIENRITKTLKISQEMIKYLD